MTASPSLPFVDFSEALPPETALLLSACHHKLDDPRANKLRQCASAVADWPAAMQQSRHHFIHALVYRHLNCHAADLVPDDVLSAMKSSANGVITRNLRLLHEMRTLERDFLGPMGVPSLAFKGVTLGERFYGEQGLRHARDLDVLLPAEHIFEVALAMQQAGYRLKDSATVPDRSSFRAYCELTAEVNFISPNGILIELHQVLDFTGAQYPVNTTWLFGAAEQQRVGGITSLVLPTTELFIYICYHHARHQWSRLHWVADLSAVMAHPSFDLSAIRERARALGLLDLIESAIFLKQKLLDNANIVPPTGFAKAMLRDCLSNLAPGATPPEIERERLCEEPGGIWRFRLANFLWNLRVNTHFGNRLKYLWHLTRPAYPDYRFIQLPRRAWALYMLLRPFRWLVEGLSGRRRGAN